jgi:hypothetical protein
VAQWDGRKVAGQPDHTCPSSEANLVESAPLSAAAATDDDGDGGAYAYIGEPSSMTSATNVADTAVAALSPADITLKKRSSLLRDELVGGVKIVRMDRDTAERMLLGCYGSGPGYHIFRESRSAITTGATPSLLLGCCFAFPCGRLNATPFVATSSPSLPKWRTISSAALLPPDALYKRCMHSTSGACEPAVALSQLLECQLLIVTVSNCLRC